MQPTYLVLDEPTSMLDPEGRADVLGIVARLRADGHGVLHITHDLADVAEANRAVVLDAGRIVFEGAPSGALRATGAARRRAASNCPRWPILAEELRRLGASVPAATIAPEALVEAVWR